jgi:predicted CXXCH cytochrome family protein
MQPRARKNRTVLVGALAVPASIGIGFVVQSRVTTRAPSVSPVAPGTSSVSAANAGAQPGTAPARGGAREPFVGSAACAACHAPEFAAYQRSHHAAALTQARPERLAAQLKAGAFSTPLGGATRFAQRDDKVEVTTRTAQSQSQSFPVAYVAGVAPLEQYVVATERGKLQSLGVVWDTRPLDTGGARWFHVYGPRGIAPTDELFFATPAQNWNHVCADCHSTFVERRYDAAADAFDTRWAELSVGCESCHGPGAGHVRAAEAARQDPTASDSRKTLRVSLRRAEPWMPSATGSPTPRAQDGVEVEVCAPCHSRRQPIHEGFLAGDPLLDSFEPELLRPGRFHADGQVEGEVYEWASFSQSRMFASGVRCSDCHEPHSAELYAPGNALCVRCHDPSRFDQESHSHHAGTGAPACVDCHMPSAKFMQIDVRRDHSIRIPRPDSSVAFGTPNACTGCHAQRSASWAAATLNSWFPAAPPRPHFVEALGRDRQGTLDAGRALNTLVREGTAPAIARASALERLADYPTKQTLETLARALSSREPLVVFGAVLGASQLPLPDRARLLLPLVLHPLRVVRIAAAKALAPLPTNELDAEARAALERAFAEVEASFEVSASLPATHVEWSAFELARGRVEQGKKELEAALRLEPCLAAAHLNRADLARAEQDEAGAERELREALRCEPRNAFAHHALGLWQVRQHDTRAALASLRRAVDLAPDETRFRYVLAVGLAETGDAKAAVAVLDEALARRPASPELLQALAEYETRLEHPDKAAGARRRLEEVVRP